jgi:hypothetical protein
VPVGACVRMNAKSRSCLVALGLVLVGAGNADAASYVQHACHLPDGTVAPADGFVSTATAPMRAEDRCASGGGLTTVLATGDVPAPVSAQWRFDAPADLTLEAVKLVRTFRNIFREGTPKRVTSISFAGENLDGCGYFGPCDETRVLSRKIEAGGPLILESSCVQSPCEGTTATEGLAAIDSIELTLGDHTPPVFVDAPHGDLLVGEPISGTRSVTFGVSDKGGGVADVALLVDGQEVQRSVADSNDGACVRPYVHAVPCRLDVTTTLQLDTTSLAEGDHTVSIVAFDATGSNSAEAGPYVVSVQNSAATAASDTKSSTPLALTLRGRAFRRKAITVRSGQPRRVRGQLLGPRGTAIADERLIAYQATDVPGATYQPVARFRTDSEGRFSFTLPAGPSRRILIGSPALGEVGGFQVRVPAPIRLQASRTKLQNKQKLVLTAYLLGSAVPPDTADVAFQVRIGKHWRTFATRSLDREGLARVKHRFKVTFHRMTYRFRAVVVGRVRFPYENAVTPAVTVHVN